MSQWKNTKINASVLLPQLVGGPAVALGVTYCAENFASHQMRWLKNIVSRHLVEPHLKLFESLGGGLHHAHEQYDKKKQAERARLGKPPKTPGTPDTPQERAEGIADVLVTSSLTFVADVAASYGLQRMLNKVWSASTRPSRIAMVDASVQLGLIALLPTAFASLSENINHSISRTIRKITGIDKKRAEDISVPFTYVALPGLLASLVSLGAAHYPMRR